MSARPSVSMVFLTYNQEAYVEKALASVLKQDFPPLEIVISDDCSSDGTFDLLRSLIARYSGPHTVRLRANPVNLGITRHVRAAVQETTGELVIFAAGDDVAHPDRVSVLVDAWQTAGGGPAMLYSDYVGLLASGERLTEPHQIYPGPHTLELMADGIVQVLGATSAITRGLLDDFAPMIPSVRYEDRVLPFRALLSGGEIIFVPQPLIDYRLGVGVSQQRAHDTRHYLYEHSMWEERTRLADAVQRLSDLMAVRPDDGDLRSRCERTILTHEARISFAQSRGRNLERLLALALLQGGSRRTALKLYAKHRFHPLARFMMRI